MNQDFYTFTKHGANHDDNREELSSWNTQRKNFLPEYRLDTVATY